MEYSVNFTREPIIETVITPREGCNLAIRNSKGNGHDDYFVDAVEVVSFGHSFFFRSQERPNSFLVPVSDYEVLELKETRMVLKNVAIDRSIKIGGGRETPPPKQREVSTPDIAEMKNPSLEGASDKLPEQRKRDNKRRRGRRNGGRPDISASETKTTESFERTGASVAEGMQGEEVQKAPSFISKLFPPPTMLIKDTLSRYKLTETEDVSSQILEEKPEGFAPEDPNLFEIPLDSGEEISIDSDEDLPSED